MNTHSLVPGTQFTAVFRNNDAWITARIVKINFLQDAVTYTFKVLESNSPAFKEGKTYTHKGRVLYDAIESIWYVPDNCDAIVDSWSNEELTALLKEECEYHYKLLLREGYSREEARRYALDIVGLLY